MNMTRQRRRHPPRRTTPCTVPSTTHRPARESVLSAPSSAVFVGGMILSTMSSIASSSSLSSCFVSSPLTRSFGLSVGRIPSSPPEYSMFDQTSKRPATSTLCRPLVSRQRKLASQNWQLSFSPRSCASSLGFNNSRKFAVSQMRPFSGKSVSLSEGSSNHEDENDEHDGRNSDISRNNSGEETNKISHNDNTGIGHFYADDIGSLDDTDDTEEEYDYMKASLDKISWLPSVTLGKQPFKAQSWPVSRRENIELGRYESLEDNETNPPGYKNVEILPVLPMAMVHGLEGILDADDSDDIFGNDLGYASGVWEEESSSIMSAMGPIFSGTSSYLPHTKGHVFTVAEPRYKKLYDDLLRIGSYYGRKRENTLRRARENGDESDEAELLNSASLPDPDEKRRFIVTVANPREEGVFAEYGLLFQLRDLDEIGAVSSMGVGDGMTLEDLSEIMASSRGYDDDEDEDDIMSALLQTHYEAKHDVVGRVKIHRFVNPECWSDGPDSEEYLMAEATILDVVENDRAKMLEERRKKLQQSVQEADDQLTTMSVGRKIEEQTKMTAVGDVASAVARIKEELRSAVGDTFKQQQKSDQIKDELRSALNDALVSSPKQGSGSTAGKNSQDASYKQSASKRSIPLVPKGVLVDKRSDESLTKEERALRESFAKLVALQHELREECRFTRVSINTFGIGPVGSWLSAAAWSQFLEKRMEASHGDMQSDLQSKLAEFLAGRDDLRGGLAGKRPPSVAAYETDDDDEAETIDFDELSPELQHEFQLVQARAADELGPLALERAIQVQRIVQAVTYRERLTILKECVDSERRRLEAKKGLQSALDSKSSDDEKDLSRMSRTEARSIFERLMTSDFDGKVEDQDGGSFQ